MHVPKHTVALKVTEGPNMLGQCSRFVPQHVTGFWEVSPDTVALLERNFWHLARLFGTAYRPSSGPSSHADPVELQHELDLQWDQYIGVIIDGQRYIYVNHGAGNWDKCQTKACVICDGGPGFWGVLFNVNTLEFSQYQANGMAFRN